MKNEAVRNKMKKKEKGERKKEKEKEEKEKGGVIFFVNIWLNLIINVAFHDTLKGKLAVGE